MAMRLTLGHIDELDDSVLASPGNQGWAGCSRTRWTGAGLSPQNAGRPGRDLSGARVSSLWGWP
jgi:hypothetical protein